MSTKLKNENRDPITGEPGSHPIGTSVGAAAGVVAGMAGAAAAGAAMGSVVGPAGTIAGAAVGGIVGGLAGSSVAEDINPTDEDAYWRETFRTRDYVAADSSYDTYAPAYRYGVDSYINNQGRDYSEIEPDLSKNWNSVRGNSKLDWKDARYATRDAYERLYSAEDDSI